MKLLLTILLLASPLPACTVLAGDRILGADLAAAHSGFRAIGPTLDLGPAPATGSRRTLRWFELERLAKDHALTLAPDAAREACFERASLVLDEAALTPILRASLDTQPRTADALFEIADFSRNPLPVGTPDFPLDGLAQTGLWRGRLLYGENRSVPIWVRVRVTGITGKTLAVLREPSVPGVSRGDTVRVEVWSGSVRLAFDAAAESSGHVGEQVTVRNPANGQRFRAVVESKGKVEIHK